MKYLTLILLLLLPCGAAAQDVPTKLQALDAFVGEWRSTEAMRTIDLVSGADSATIYIDTYGTGSAWTATVDSVRYIRTRQYGLIVIDADGNGVPDATDVADFIRLLRMRYEEEEP